MHNSLDNLRVSYESLVILLVTDLAHSSRDHKIIKTKRYVRSNENSKDFLPYNEPFVSKATNVRVIPRENFTWENFAPPFIPSPPDRRMDETYKGDEKTDSSSFNRGSWANEMSPNSTYGSFSTSPKSQTLSFKSGFTVEGTTISGTTRENARTGNEYRPNEINDWMQKELDRNSKGASEFGKKTFRNPGSPFRPSSKGPDYEQNHRSRPSNLWLKSTFVRSKKKPLTLLMDIYPMSQETGEEEPAVEGTEKKTHLGSRGNVIYIPIRSKNGIPESVISHLMSPREKENRMLIKLNLYPTGRIIRGKRVPANDDEDMGVGEEAYLEVVGPGRRNSPSSSKYKKFRKKIKSKRCSVYACRNSSGKPGRKRKKIRRLYPLEKIFRKNSY